MELTKGILKQLVKEALNETTHRGIIVPPEGARSIRVGQLKAYLETINDDYIVAVENDRHRTGINPASLVRIVGKSVTIG